MLELQATFVSYDTKEYVIDGKTVYGRTLCVTDDENRMLTFKSANLAKELPDGLFAQYSTGDKIKLEGLFREVKRLTTYNGKSRNEVFMTPVWYNIVGRK